MQKHPTHSQFAIILKVALCLKVSLLAGNFIASNLSASQWPTYRADAQRSGFTTNELPDQLSLHWTFQSGHHPQPAWPRSNRLKYDRAAHCVIARQTLFFGDSVTGIVHALDIETGKPRWEYYTSGPVRFAPTCWNDRLFVVSDDGFLYALNIDDGSLLWKYRGGPNDQMAIGNQRVISKWPARGGPVVVGDVIYFAAGIWPSDGIFVYALNANTGKLIWKNDQSGQIYMPQPHGGANANSGISAQGYLVATGDQLLVPTGRAVPAALNRLNGKLEFFHLQKHTHSGGGEIIATRNMFLNSGLIFQLENGEALGKSGAGQIATTPDGIVRAYQGMLARYRWKLTEKRDRKGRPIPANELNGVWNTEKLHQNAAIIVANNKVISGCQDAIDVLDLNTGKRLWTAPVNGTAYGLAVSNSRLIVSTDHGLIYSYGLHQSTPANVIKSRNIKAPYPSNSVYARAAANIIQQSKIDSGYCVHLGCGDGAFAYELATRSTMRVIAIESDKELVALARKKLQAAGLYGTRVSVLHRDLKHSNCPNRFANLVISSRSITQGATEVDLAEAQRLQRPYGGILCYGKPGHFQFQKRRAVNGAGEWTHQYADAGNTLCSDDKLIKGRLSMLWYRDIDFVIPSRHGRGPAPLFANGRLFHEGNDGLIAVDAFNGQELWRFEIKDILKAYDGDELMGASGTGSNYCLGGNFVFIRHQEYCLQLDSATGKLIRKYEVPKSRDPSVKQNKQPWGYIAWHDGTLIGSAADPEHVVTYRYRSTTGNMRQQLTESNRLFAFDVKTGKLKWQHDSQDSIRHNAIAIADNKIYLIDRPLADFDLKKESRRNPSPTPKVHPTGQLFCLNIKNGYVLWRNDKNIYGTMLAVSARNNALLMSYQPTSFALASEKGGHLTVFNSQTGEKTWGAEAKYRSRPLINGKTVYAQGGAWDLISGKPKEFNFKRSYGCGILASCESMMFFRSATLGYFDFTKNKKIENYGGVRPGCWINAIPAGGLVLVPDASASCRCSYLNKSWFALEASSNDSTPEPASK